MLCETTMSAAVYKWMQHRITNSYFNLVFSSLHQHATVYDIFNELLYKAHSCAKTKSYRGICSNNVNLTNRHAYHVVIALYQKIGIIRTCITKVTNSSNIVLSILGYSAFPITLYNDSKWMALIHVTRSRYDVRETFLQGNLVTVRTAIHNTVPWQKINRLQTKTANPITSCLGLH